jgi:choline dehydrogenase
MNKAYDYVIVGGGSAGCVLASRLSEDPQVSVLLLEAGGRPRDPVLAIPGTCFLTYGDPRFNWGYWTEPQKQLNGRKLAMIQAKLLGGGGAINGMVHTRGPAAIYDAWAAQGADGWSYADVLPFFKRMETSDRGEGPAHGGAGPLKVVRGRSELPLAKLGLAAFAEAGFPIAEDLNAPEPDGLGFYDWAIADGRRGSAPATYPGFDPPRANLHVALGAAATRLLFEGARVVGVEIAGEHGPQPVRAEREVALALGAINTPRLLLLSGVGPADELRAVGVEARLDHPRVGKNLQNHTAHRLSYQLREPISMRRYLHPLHGAREVLRYAFGRGGFFACGASPVGGFVRSDAALAAPDVQVFFSLGLMQPKAGLGMLPKEHGLSFGFNQGSPWSRGDVTLRSADPTAPPAIDPGYMEGERDLEVTAAAAERFREVAAAPSLAKVIAQEFAPGPAVKTRDDWKQDIRANAGNHYHVCGTCSMGRDASSSVTNAKLQVHGVEGLRVADASAMPLLMNGNTNAAVMMVAERAAAFMKAG